MNITDSVLTSIKKLLGIAEDSNGIICESILNKIPV